MKATELWLTFLKNAGKEDTEELLKLGKSVRMKSGGSGIMRRRRRGSIRSPA